MANKNSICVFGGAACISSMVDSGIVESRRYYIARLTLIQMLQDRGYIVPNMEAELRRSLPDFRSTFGDNPDPERLRLMACRASHPSRKILAIFCEYVEIRKRNIIGILSQIVNKEMLDRVILILQGKISSYSRKVLDEYPVKVEIFQITDFLVNITDHLLGPKHEILTPLDKEKLLKKYSIVEKQLPKMVENDGIARYYGLEKGQVVKITYSGGLTDSLVTYRCVH